MTYIWSWKHWCWPASFVCGRADGAWRGWEIGPLTVEWRVPNCSAQEASLAAKEK